MGGRCIPDFRVHRGELYRDYPTRPGASIGILYRVGLHRSPGSDENGAQRSREAHLDDDRIRQIDRLSSADLSASPFWVWRYISGLAGSRLPLPNIAFPFVIILCTAAYLILLLVLPRVTMIWLLIPRMHRSWNCPALVATAITGLYYILPIVILIWCIIVERPVTGSVGFLGNDRHDHGCASPSIL